MKIISKAEAKALGLTHYYTGLRCNRGHYAPQGRNRRSTKIKGEDLLEIYKMLDAGLSGVEVSRRFGCTDSNICVIKRNREKYFARGLGKSTKAAA